MLDNWALDNRALVNRALVNRALDNRALDNRALGNSRYLVDERFAAAKELEGGRLARTVETPRSGVGRVHGDERRL